jgi:septum site-determining protein MinC
MLSVTRLRVIDPGVDAIREQLQQFARQMPQAVKGMAVILDSEQPLDLAQAVAAMRAIGMQPLGVGEGPLAEFARSLGLAVLSKDTGKGGARQPPAEAPPPVAAVPEPRKPTRIVTEPVRSGQQIYAEHTDLVVMNTVSPGAEVIADGCVHVYGKLAGRAVAGASGDTSARIFCRKMEAELLAIAGVYAVADKIKDAPMGQPVMAYLERGALKIEHHK